jgi:hypothetical protein
MRDMQFNAQGRILGVKVKDDQVTARSGRGPLAGAHATLETTGDVHRRVTATRLLATGVFAFALKKKHDDRTLWLTIEGQGFQAVAEVEPKNERVARQWMAEFNTRAAQAGQA